MKIDAIPGEATDDAHKDWIQLLSFSHSVVQPHASAGGGGARGGAERAELSEFIVTKNVDKSTPGLLLHCCNGVNLNKVTVNIVRQVDSKLKYMVYEFETCLIRSVSISGGGGVVPSEQASLSFRKISLRYTPVDAQTNKEGEPKNFHWDLLSNKGGAS